MWPLRDEFQKRLYLAVSSLTTLSLYTWGQLGGAIQTRGVNALPSVRNCSFSWPSLLNEVSRPGTGDSGKEKRNCFQYVLARRRLLPPVLFNRSRTINPESPCLITALGTAQLSKWYVPWCTRVSSWKSWIVLLLYLRVSRALCWCSRPNKVLSRSGVYGNPSRNVTDMLPRRTISVTWGVGCTRHSHGTFNTALTRTRCPVMRYCATAVTDLEGYS